MLNVGALHEGFVLDHIKAGKAMTIYHDLKLDKLDCTVAIIKNAKSNKDGRQGHHQSRMPDREPRPGHPRFHRSQHHRQHHQRREDR